MSSLASVGGAMGRFGSILVSSLSAALLGGCSIGPFATGELRFLQWNNPVKVEGAAGGRTISASELAPVPAMPLLNVTNPLTAVDFSGTNVSLAPVDNQGLPGQQIEAHLFVDNLSDTNDALRSVGAASPVQQWDDRAGLSHRGASLAIPFPPRPNWSLTQRFPVGPPFLPIWFWPTVAPEDPAAGPEGQGSIKSVRIYKPGLCSTEVAFTQPNNQGIFDQISDTLFEKFSENSSLDHGSAVRGYSRITTLLDDGIDVFGPRGGFILFFWFRASGGGGLQSVNFAANYDYAFTLKDGRVALEPKRNDLLVQPQQSFKDFRDALEIDLPKGINESFALQQQAPPVAPPGQPDNAPVCNSGDDPTSVARLFYGIAAAQGGATLGYSSADQKNLTNAISQPGNWTCGPDGKARFTLRAKRINIYADGIELVWFDKADVNDPLYALYAAAVSQQQSQSLCSRPRTVIVKPTDLPFKRRFITTVNR